LLGCFDDDVAALEADFIEGADLAALEEIGS